MERLEKRGVGERGQYKVGINERKSRNLYSKSEWTDRRRLIWRIEGRRREVLFPSGKRMDLGGTPVSSTDNQIVRQESWIVPRVTMSWYPFSCMECLLRPSSRYLFPRYPELLKS